MMGRLPHRKERVKRRLPQSAGLQEKRRESPGFGKPKSRPAAENGVPGSFSPSRTLDLYFSFK
jgi:hypothetical protein